MASKLNARFVSTAKAPGKYGDANGLMLLVKASGRKSWVQRIVIRGARVDMGLGGADVVTLAEARDLALANKRIARAGGDPRQSSTVPTFREAAISTWKIQTANARNPKHRAQWIATIETYVNPTLGDRPVSDITPKDIMGALVPIWLTKPETARRTKQRISTVMRWCVAQGHREFDPVTVIGAALPKNGSLRRHHRTCGYEAVSDALRRIRECRAYPTTKLAFELLVLTACRSGEVRGARWEEIDLGARMWTIPAQRMKAEREHVVPLSDAAIDVLREAAELRDLSGLVFPSARGRVMSDMTLSKLAKEVGVAGTPHGMRSAFRMWAAERTDVPREVAEECLAHVNPNRVEAAYQHSSLLEKRRLLLDRWARYVTVVKADVVSIR